MVPPLLRFLLLALLARSARAITWGYSEQDSDKRTTWSYSGSTGPENWVELGFPECGGRRQSPIDIDACSARQRRRKPLVLRGFDDVPQLLNLTNDLHTAVARGNWRGGLPEVFGADLPGTFRVFNVHFHWGVEDAVGSEHTLNGRRFPLEMHIVCKNAKYSSVEEALQKVDGLAVLAVLFDTQARSRGRGVIALTPALSRIKEGESTTQVETAPSLLELMPTNLRSFVQYGGSLTTPGCQEVVTWTVFLDLVRVLDVELELFRSLRGYDDEPIGNNFRPTQMINGRRLQRSGPDSGAKHICS